MNDQLLLIDLNSLARPIFEVSGKEPDTDWTSTQIVARVRALSSAHPHAAICIDMPPYDRKRIDPAYKANRDATPASYLHQVRLAQERLKEDGFPVWGVPGLEADDIIASAVREALSNEHLGDTTILVVSSDKDLLALAAERVSVKSVTTGNIAGPDEVLAKFKVKPEQMPDYLALVGDTSDNIVGAKGIGGVTAADLLNRFGSLEALFAAVFAKIPHIEAQVLVEKMAKAGEPEVKRIKKDLETRTPVTPGVFLSLTEFYTRWPTVAALIALRPDAAIPFHEIATERVPQEAEPMSVEPSDDQVFQAVMAQSVGTQRVPFERGNDANDAPLPWAEPLRVKCDGNHGGPRCADPDCWNDSRELNQNESLAAMNQATARVAERIGTVASDVKNPTTMRTGAVVSEQGLTPAAPVDFNQQLEPRNMDEAVKLAQRAFESRLFSGFGTPQAVLMAVMAGRELGLSAMASLRSIHVIENKPCLSADIMRAVVLKSGLAEYFRCVETTPDRATFETRRKGEPSSMSLTFTMADATTAGVVKKGSGWEKFPSDMLRARASAKLCRLTYPDVIAGLYDPSEL